MSDYNFLDIPYRRSKIHCKDNYLFEYFYKYLFDKVMALFDFNLPTEWDKQYFMERLFHYGVIAIVKTNEFGVIPQECSVSGWNVYKKPTRATISNALINQYDFRIGKDCELVFIDYSMKGLSHIVSYYADLLALTSESYKINQINTRKTAIVNVENKVQAETLKKAYDNLTSGDSAVFLSYGGNPNGKPWEFFSENNAYIGTNLLNDLQTIENDFDTAIGLNTCNTQKKERMIVSEVESNNQSTAIKPLYWINTMSTCFEKVKSTFGIDLGVNLRCDMTGDTVKDGDADDEYND